MPLENNSVHLQSLGHDQIYSLKSNLESYDILNRWDSRQRDKLGIYY